MHATTTTSLSYIHTPQDPFCRCLNVGCLVDKDRTFPAQLEAAWSQVFVCSLPNDLAHDGAARVADEVETLLEKGGGLGDATVDNLIQS